MDKPTGQFGKYAEEIVREYNKVGTGDERKDWAARDKINKILRMLGSFKLKAWVMGDGTVAIADTKPRGAKQDVNDLIAPLYNAEAKGCNAKFKVGDKVTYWVFDKKAKGDVKAVRGERIDIDDGHGGVVTFKAKDLEVWNTKVCNSTNPVVVKAMNACARNAASVFEYGVGDMVELSSGRKGKVLAKYEKDGDLKIDVDIAGTRMTFGTKDIARVVGNACGTVRNGYVTLRSKFGGTAQVREGDYVEYKGKKCKVLRLDEPVGHAWIEDELEHEYQPKYFELKALNACGTAKNAGDKDEKVLDGVKSEAKVLYRQLADIARKFDALDQKARKGGWYYADWKDMAKWVRDLLDGKTY